jgi:hypothetical protein
VDYPRNECDELTALEAWFALWQSESVDDSTTSCALSVGADSALDPDGVLRSRDAQESKTDWQLQQSVGNQDAPKSARFSAVGCDFAPLDLVDGYSSGHTLPVMLVSEV